MSNEPRYPASRSRAALLLLLVSPAISSLLHAQGDTLRVSLDSVGAQANARSTQPFASSDGRYVVFVSEASNLVAGDTNGLRDVFLRDMLTGTTQRVSVSSTGTQANGASFSPSVSADGRYVAFASQASNLSPFDANGLQDVFLKDMSSGAVTLISNGNATGGGGGDAFSYSPQVSPDGRWVAYYSGATNLVLGDANGWSDAFLTDAQSPGLNTTIVSVSTSGIQSDYPSGPIDPEGRPEIAVSNNGLFVAFQTEAGNLGTDINGLLDVYLRDVAAQTTTRVSTYASGIENLGASYLPNISADGGYVAFWSASNQIIVGNPSGVDAIRWERLTGTKVLVTVSSQGAWQIPAPFGGGEQPLTSLGISDDGDRIAFDASAINLVPDDSNDLLDVFLREISTGRTTRMSVDTLGQDGDARSYGSAISRDGTRIVFTSESTDLVAGDTNAAEDVFTTVPHLEHVRFCFGDGTGPVACPCANTGAPERGCENAVGTGGASMSATGTASLASDTLTLVGANLPPGTSVLFFRGTTQVALPFGDGIRCANNVLRFGTRVADALGYSSYGFGPADAPIGTEVPPMSPGDTRIYQGWYRSALTLCGPNTFNMTSAVNVTWTP